MKRDVTLVSDLTIDTATHAVYQRFGCVLDLRSGKGFSSRRPIEENVVKTLDQGCVAYRQLPVSLSCDSDRTLHDARVMILSTPTPLLLVVDDVEAWRDDLAFVDVPTRGLRKQVEPTFVPLDKAA